MSLSQIVIASHNANKLREIGQMIAPYGIAAMSAAEKNVEEPEETEPTFEGNAILKAEHTAKATGLPALADDSGLVVPALGGAPGVYSARWANKDYPGAFRRLEKELGDKPRDAHFTSVLALCIPTPSKEGMTCKTHLFEGKVHGTLTFPPRGDRGFGYDPVFIPNGYDITFGEFDPDTKNRISHRGQAFTKFLDFLNGPVMERA